MRLVVGIATFAVACGGSPATPDGTMSPDATPDAAPPTRMFGIDVSPAPSESYTDVISLARSNGATFIPQAIDWSMIEAGPDDGFDHAHIDAHKWDISGPFAIASGKAR